MVRHDPIHDKLHVLFSYIGRDTNAYKKYKAEDEKDRKRTGKRMNAPINHAYANHPPQPALQNGLHTPGYSGMSQSLLINRSSAS